jgi:hypothetical protein
MRTTDNVISKRIHPLESRKAFNLDNEPELQKVFMHTPGNRGYYNPWAKISRWHGEMAACICMLCEHLSLNRMHQYASRRMGARMT